MADDDHRASFSGDADFLPRLLSKWRVASRREAELLVKQGRVTVDGRTCRDVVCRINPRHARVTVDGVPVGPPTGRDAPASWLVLNKPRGVVTTASDPEGRRTVMDLIPPPRPAGVFPVGRLDRASAGLLLLTNDHSLADRLLDPRTAVPRTYRVRVRGAVNVAMLDRIRRPATLDGVRYGPLDLDIERTTVTGAWLGITLREGKNREIRRRLAVEDLAVLHLIRVAFGPVTLGSLAPGASRPLTPAERTALAAVAKA